MRTLSQILKEGRSKAGISTSEACKLIGVGIRAIQSIESGDTRINDIKLKILTDAYNIHYEIAEYFCKGSIGSLTWQHHLRQIQPSNISEALLIIADVAKKTC